MASICDLIARIRFASSRHRAFAIVNRLMLGGLFVSLLLGIDVGTGGTRALVVDERGGIVASATAEHAPFASPQTGWAEQDPHDWWRASREAVHAVLRQPGVSADAIGAIGLSGQMHGSTLLDANDEVVRPALLWCDQRTHAPVPADHRDDRRRAPHRADVQSRPDRIHGAQAAVGARARAGRVARASVRCCCPRTTCASASPGTRPPTSPTRRARCCSTSARGNGPTRCCASWA